MVTFDFLFSIYPRGAKNVVPLRLGGGGMHGSHSGLSSKCYRFPVYNFVSFDCNLTSSHKA